MDSIQYKKKMLDKLRKMPDEKLKEGMAKDEKFKKLCEEHNLLTEKSGD